MIVLHVKDMKENSGMDKELMQEYAELGIAMGDLLLSMITDGGAYAAIAASALSAHIIEICVKPESAETAMDDFFKTIRDSVNATMQANAGAAH